MKKILGILIMTLLILSTILPLANSLKINNSLNDQIDQQQTQGDFCKIPSDTWCWAQSFKPTLPILTRVEIMVSGSYKCSIRSALDGADLTSISKTYPSPPHNWQFFDFPDITVTPESTYYIVLIPQNADASICGGDNNPYNRGCMYMSEDGGYTWGEPLTGDMQFKTYGNTEGCDDFMGLCIEPLGDAFLDIDDELSVYNLDDDGDDGVIVDLEGYNAYSCNLKDPFNNDLETTLNFRLSGMNEEEPLWMELRLKSDGASGRFEKALSSAKAAQCIIGFGPDDDIVINKEIEEISDLGFLTDENSNNNLQFSGIYCADDDSQKGHITQIMTWQHTVEWTWKEQDVDKLPIKKLMVRGIIENVESESYIADSSITSIGTNEFTIVEHYAYTIDPPSEPGINGPTEGKSGKAYDYEINNIGTSDVYFLIDWDDDSEIEHTDLTSPGMTETVSHTWTEDGTYNVKTRSMNKWGTMSNWVSLEVSMPKNKAKTIHTPILKLLENHQFLRLMLLGLFGT